MILKLKITNLNLFMEKVNFIILRVIVIKRIKNCATSTLFQNKCIKWLGTFNFIKNSPFPISSSQLFGVRHPPLKLPLDLIPISFSHTLVSYNSQNHPTTFFSAAPLSFYVNYH